MDGLGLSAVRTTQSLDFSAGVNLTVNSCHGFPEETPALVATATACSLERIAVARWLTARICRSHGGM